MCRPFEMPKHTEKIKVFALQMNSKLSMYFNKITYHCYIGQCAQSMDLRRANELFQWMEYEQQQQKIQSDLIAFQFRMGQRYGILCHLNNIKSTYVF